MNPQPLDPQSSARNAIPASIAAKRSSIAPLLPTWDNGAMIPLDLFERFLLDKRAAGRSPSTIQFYQHTGGKFARSVPDLSPDTTRNYLANLTGLAPGGLHGHCRGVRAFLKWCEAQGLIDKAPKISMPRVYPRRPCPTDDDLARLVGVVRTKRELAVLSLLASTGLRRSEAASLTWANVDLVDRTATVVGKGGKRRTVFLNEDTAKILTGLPRNGRVLGLKSSGIRQVLRRLAERAGVNVSSHQLRRWYASSSWRNGCDLLSLSELMGHASVEQTRAYIKTDLATLRRAYLEHGPRL